MPRSFGTTELASLGEDSERILDVLDVKGQKERLNVKNTLLFSYIINTRDVKKPASST